MPEPELERALVDLLGATRDLTIAYDAWAHAPRPFQATRRADLDRANERLTSAQRKVASVQRSQRRDHEAFDPARERI